MNFESLLFWVFTALSITSAIGVVTHKSIVYSALYLILVFLSISAFFVLNNADFLAIAQLIVYAVGLTIILMFGVMFTGEHLREDQPVPKSQIWLFGTVATMVGVLLVGIAQFPYLGTPPTSAIVSMLRTEGTTALLGQTIFQQYAIPFELASVLLLVAMVGAILIAKRTLQRPTVASLNDRTRLSINSASAPRELSLIPDADPSVDNAVDTLVVTR